MNSRPKHKKVETQCASETRRRPNEAAPDVARLLHAEISEEERPVSPGENANELADEAVAKDVGRETGSVLVREERDPQKPRRGKSTTLQNHVRSQKRSLVSKSSILEGGTIDCHRIDRSARKWPNAAKMKV